MLRGAGIRRKVCLNTPVPRDWKNFLRNNENKKELFSLISEKIIGRAGKEIISTAGPTIRCSRLNCLHPGLQPCNHEEADTRLLLHAKEASQAGHKSIIIRTVDTDVIVISLAAFADINLEALWIAFGTGKDFELIPIHRVFNKIGPEKAAALPFFHAFTGSDTTSAFNKYGKKSAWETLNNFPEVLTAFQVLSNKPKDVETLMCDIEQFVVLMYDKTSSQTSVNKCRKELFTKKSRFFDGLPPTRAALIQHVLRCAYQAGYCWGQCLEKEQELPDPAIWGWTAAGDGEWAPNWSLLPEASLACQELLSCGCKSCNTKRCKCKKAMLKCTMLCKCEDCENGYKRTEHMENHNTDDDDEGNETANYTDDINEDL
ncbi:unnamed protein product [Bemisia tabaci]|uniref:Tesmin/TSO1-like CXC domain-containing protein n=1 Tax=Bemisia tabaci TaxID=7038 RepID=A0A9P0A0Y9_BEMTA|nr:unnamed protein product [Bemisia tabaci]